MHKRIVFLQGAGESAIFSFSLINFTDESSELRLMVNESAWIKKCCQHILMVRFVTTFWMTPYESGTHHGSFSSLWKWVLQQRKYCHRRTNFHKQFYFCHLRRHCIILAITLTVLCNIQKHNLFLLQSNFFFLKIQIVFTWLDLTFVQKLKSRKQSNVFFIC